MGTILIVDPERDVRLALEKILRSAGDLSVLQAEDGAGALAALGAQPVDLVIADHGIPDMDGASLLGRVQQDHPELPGILLTDDAELDRGDLNEAVPIVTKPWDDDKLRGMVLDTLSRRIENSEKAMLMRVAGITEKQLKRAERIKERLYQDRTLGEILVELNEMSRSDHDRVIRERRSRMTVPQLLVEDRHLSALDYDGFMAARAANPDVPERMLLVGQLVSEEHYLKALCAKHGLAYLEPEVGLIDTKVLAKTSIRYLQRVHAMPVHVLDGKLRVIMSDPLDSNLLRELQGIFDKPIEACCCSSEKIKEALKALERMRSGGDGEDAGLALQYREIGDVQDTEETGEEAVQIVDYLLARAIQLGASDLHIEPMQNKIRVRVRIDGVLTQLTDLPIEFAPRVVSRVKILASADIAEKRLHQDGKICVKIDGSEVDIRLSSYVSIYGETLVMRLLDRNKGIVPLDKIGFTPRCSESLEEVVLESSSGLVLLVGPTGSGKTTTLYSFIDHANDPTEKVITAEDPVEYVIEGIVQCGVNMKTGPTFNDSLKAMMRQDPDTIVVGEIRDKITVSLALECALTGHKVFSTFHTEDAVGAFVRMLEMGAESFLVASTVSAIIAQRLTRRLCPSCKKKGDVTAAEARYLGLDRADLRKKPFWVAVGCSECKDSGYKGRLAIHEVLLPDDDLRDAVLHKAPAKELRKLARNLPEFLTLQEDAVLKAAQGLTTLEEVIGNAPRDTAARPLKTLMQIGKIGRLG